MDSRQKHLGLVISALLLAGLLTPSSASAAFKAESTPAKLKVVQNGKQIIEPKFGSEWAVECSGVKLYNAVIAASPTTTLTAEPEWYACEKFLEQPTVVDENGCKFVFHFVLLETKGTMDIECPAGKTIDVTVGAICTYSIGTQTGLSEVDLINFGEGPTRVMVIQPQITNMTVIKSGNILCPPGSNEGTYRGFMDTRGENPITAQHIGVFAD